MDNSFEKLINRVLDSRYKIENVVGIGGMAYVLKASDLKQDGRPVAIKILNQEFNDDENAVKRFVNESEAIAMVDSPNIVKIYDVAISENLKYIVMEFVDGITLKDYIDKVGALGWKEAVHYVRQILKALSHAHEKGIVHRDVKPQNVMLLRDGKVKVTDFGIAKMPTSEPLTMTDKAIGTVNYISPEQASGGKVDEKSDIYSVGVMLYEMLTGVLPFTAESPVAVAMMQVSEEPKSPREINSQIPVGLEQIIIKSMSKDPAARFGSASSMEKALEYFVANPSVVFSGVAENTGTSEEVRKNLKEKNKREKMENSKRKHRSMFPIVLGITLSFFTVVIVSCIILWNSFWGDYNGSKNPEELDFIDRVVIFIDHLLGVEDNNNPEDEIVIENYVGELFDDELKQKLEAKGFKVIVNNENTNKDKPDRVIINQSPKAGDLKKAPTEKHKIELVLYVNNNSKKIYKMPDCLGKNDLSARKIIRDELRDLYGKDMDSVIEIIEKYDSSAAKGTVIASSPAAGMTIDSYNIPAKITLYISNGPEPTELMMPDVVFRLDDSGNPVRCTKDEAVKLLEEAEIKPEVKGEFNNTVEAGRIIRTEPAANTMFMSDDVVTVYYSNGKDPNAMYDMIDCSGMTEEAAKKKFVEDFGHAASSVKIEYEYSETVEKGKVIRTNPAVGKHVYADRDTVTVYVSKGNPSKMPDVLYFDLEEAKRRLKKAGISSGNVRVEFGDSFEDDGTVYDCNITVGAPVDEDAEVILYVSNGTKPSYDDLLGEAGYGD